MNLFEFVGSVVSLFLSVGIGYNVISLPGEVLERVSVFACAAFNLWMMMMLIRMKNATKKYLVNNVLFWVTELIFFVHSVTFMELLLGEGHGLFYVSAQHLLFCLIFCIQADITVLKRMKEISMGILMFIYVFAVVIIIMMLFSFFIVLLPWLWSAPVKLPELETDFKGEMVMFIGALYVILMGIVLAAAEKKPDQLKE